MHKNGVYILQSLKNGRYYIGSTNDMKRRLWEHNNKLVSATQFIAPMGVKLFIERQTLQDARRAEYRLKKYKSRKIIEKIIKDGTLPWEHNKYTLVA